MNQNLFFSGFLICEWALQVSIVKYSLHTGVIYVQFFLTVVSRFVLEFQDASTKQETTVKSSNGSAESRAQGGRSAGRGTVETTEHCCKWLHAG